MTDIITTAPIAFRSVNWLSVTPLRRRVCAAMSATFAAVGHAFAMAYAAPYGPRPSAASKIDPDGRDPSW